MASATALNPENIKDADERFFVSSGGSNYLTLTSTLLLGALAALILLVGVVVLTASAVSSSRAQKKYDHQYEETFYADSENAHTRYRRSASNDIASKMAQLEQAFKKYQVEEAECELYIACEASQEQRIEENGPLARIVFDILSTFNRAKDGHKWDDRMEGLVKAFEFGTGASASGQVDPCQPLRNKCFELHAKY